ncbi:hypothetical protein [Chryseolinea sp. H1M3-3]|uniref:hypothetical protein n=1 Tax=Chryseolinea sp. H1M3-3 TaxID=3034144 RepID=UPI0023EE10F4|nr:hypothetical protein [Chryseolinea sp. H1M3-3]
MKTAILSFALTLFAGTAFSQSFTKGSFIKPESEKIFVKGYMKKAQLENVFANKYFKSDGTAVFNRLLLNNFKLERRWDRSGNRCN